MMQSNTKFTYNDIHLTLFNINIINLNFIKYSGFVKKITSLHKINIFKQNIINLFIVIKHFK